jgi:hypothetical protein
LDLSLPPSGVGLLPNEDHLAALERQLLFARGSVGRHHSRELRLFRGFGLALEEINKFKSCFFTGTKQ